MTETQPPQTITVACYYDYMHYYTNNNTAVYRRSAESDERTINIGLRPPSLTVNSSVITEKERVKLRCRPPPSVSSNKCHFYTTHGLTWSETECVQTVKGSDLLMVDQNPPVEVQLKCLYVVERGQVFSPSVYSEDISVTVLRPTENEPPNISLQKFEDQVLIVCSPPRSANGSKCNLYFGESSQSFHTEAITKQQHCQFYVDVNDFLANLKKVETKVVSCDYTLGNGHSTLSPRSDEHNTLNFMNKHFPNQAHVTAAPFDSLTSSSRRHHTRGDSEAPSSDDRTKVTQSDVTTASTTTHTANTTAPPVPGKTSPKITKPSAPTMTFLPKRNTGDK